MRTAMKTSIAMLAMAAMLAGSGCSWWKNRRNSEPAVAEAAAPSAQAAEAALAIAPAPLSPDAEALRAATVLATDFYEMRLRLGKHGLPDAGEMKAYRAFLCPALADAMDAARARQQAYIAAHPDDKPPLVDVDLFSSLFEGPDAVSPGPAAVEGEGARVSLSMRAGEGDEGPRWRDDVLLQRQDGIWCIADVEYRGDWPFANKGKLSETLAAPF